MKAIDFLEAWTAMGNHLLVSCPSNKFTYLFDLFEDGISGCCPHERSGMFIVMSNEFFDLGDELFCAAKGVSADHACGVCGNSLGRKAVLVNFNISFFANPKPGSVIQAEARMTHVDEISGSMVIDVRTSKGQPLARCQAVIFFLNPDRSASSAKQKGTA